MKPCLKHKKNLVLFALKSLDSEKNQNLVQHLKTCPGCAAYLAEIESVYQAASEPRVTLRNSPPLPSSIHELRQRIRADAQSTPPRQFTPWFLLAPASAVVLLLAASLFFYNRPLSEKVANTNPTPPPIKTVTTPSSHKSNFQPTLAHYRASAGRSFENLDAILAAESERTAPSPDPLMISSSLE